MRNVSGQVKMSGGEKIKAFMNTGNKIFNKPTRQFLYEIIGNLRTTTKFTTTTSVD